mgnify:CR=1 FL=1
MMLKKNNKFFLLKKYAINFDSKYRNSFYGQNCDIFFSLGEIRECKF